MGGERVADRVAHVLRASGRTVFLTSDFRGAGGRRQVARVLRAMARGGVLLRIGHGLHAKAAPSPFDGRPAPLRGVGAVAEEALALLGVTLSPSAMARAYNAGRTTQVPSGRVVAVDRRVRQAIEVGGVRIRFERVPGIPGARASRGARPPDRGPPSMRAGP